MTITHKGKCIYANLDNGGHLTFDHLVNGIYKRTTYPKLIPNQQLVETAYDESSDITSFRFHRKSRTTYG